jgi:hypothetical protein
MCPQTAICGSISMMVVKYVYNGTLTRSNRNEILGNLDVQIHDYEVVSLGVKKNPLLNPYQASQLWRVVLLCLRL